MKIYKKQFENIFQSPTLEQKEKFSFPFEYRDEDGKMIFGKRTSSKDGPLLSFDGIEEEAWTEYARIFIRDWTLKEFDYLVKLLWIISKLRLNGNPVKDFIGSITLHGFSSTILDRSFAPLDSTLKVAGRLLKRDLLTFKNFSKFDLSINSYIFSFFQRDAFMEHNPFLESQFFIFPYDYIDLDFLSFVYQMDERFEILELAEKKKWSLDYFRDWVINYAYSFNLEYGDNVFLLVMDDKWHKTPYMKDKRKVFGSGLSQQGMKKKIEEYHELKKMEVATLGNIVKFKTFEECRLPQK